MRVELVEIPGGGSTALEYSRLVAQARRNVVRIAGTGRNQAPA
jgi:hypothetical protein